MHSLGKLHFELNCKFQSSIPFGASNSLLKRNFPYIDAMFVIKKHVTEQWNCADIHQLTV